MHDTLTRRQSLRNFCNIINYHRAQCLSPTQVAPGHVNEILTVDTEKVKPENPELKRLVCLFCIQRTNIS